MPWVGYQFYSRRNITQNMKLWECKAGRCATLFAHRVTICKKEKCRNSFFFLPNLISLNWFLLSNYSWTNFIWILHVLKWSIYFIKYEIFQLYCVSLIFVEVFCTQIKGLCKIAITFYLLLRFERINVIKTISYENM